MNNIIITDLMSLGPPTEIEKATHGWGGAVNQRCVPRRFISVLGGGGGGEGGGPPMPGAMVGIRLNDSLREH